MTRLVRYFADTKDANDIDIPHRCCPRCRQGTTAILQPPVNQFNYCGVCNSVWAYRTRQSRWWLTEWRISKPATLSTALWILIQVGTLFTVVIWAMLYVVTHQWANPVYIMSWLALAVAVWLLGITILEYVYRFCEKGVSWGWHYLMNTTPLGAVN